MIVALASLALLPAHAGDLTVTVTADGLTSEIKLEHVAPCEMQRFEREGAGEKVKLGAVVEPLADDKLLVTIDFERNVRGEGPWRGVKLGPAVRVDDGETSTLAFTVDDSEARMKLAAKGFEGVMCGSRASTVRRTRRSSTTEE